MMEDRVTRGSLAGLLTGLLIIANNLASYHLLHYAKARWVDMLSHLIFGRSVETPLDFALGLFLFLIFVGFLGALYAKVVMPKPGTGSYYYRGVGFGLITWFFTLMVGTLYKIPTLTTIAPETAITNIVSVTVWGALVGWLMKRWDHIYAE